MKLSSTLSDDWLLHEQQFVALTTPPVPTPRLAAPDGTGWSGDMLSWHLEISNFMGKMSGTLGRLLTPTAPGQRAAHVIFAPVWRVGPRISGLAFFAMLGGACARERSDLLTDASASDGDAPASADGGDARQVEAGGDTAANDAREDAPPGDASGDTVAEAVSTAEAGGEVASTTDAGADRRDVGTACDGGAGSGPHTVFLDFDGVALRAGPSSASASTTPLVSANVTLPAFQGGGDRGAVIASATSLIGQMLSPFDVTLVTSRPSAGDYLRLVFGGTPAMLGLPAGSAAIASVDCGNTIPSDLAIVFDTGDAVQAAAGAVQDLGALIGLDTTSLAGDCMSFSPARPTCTLGVAAPRDPSALCGSAQSLQNEPAAFTQAFGCR